MTAPVPVRDLYWSKFLLAAGVAVLGQVCIGVLYLLSGQLAGVSGGLPLQLAGLDVLRGLGGHGGVCGAAFPQLGDPLLRPARWPWGWWGALPAW